MSSADLVAAASDAHGDPTLSGPGEMRALARGIDWSTTSVGRVESWPQSLRTAVNIAFESKFPMLVCWGPDFVQFYNDPFRPILGVTKHPALGKSARDTFPEAWHIVGPLFAQVMDGTAVRFDDMLVPLDRNGFLEECYFVYSYSPIRDESGGVGGLLVTCTETSARVVAERRMNTLRELATQAAQLQDEAAAWGAAARVLDGNPADLPFALLYVLDANGREATLAADTAFPIAPRVLRAEEGEAPWPVFAVAAAGASTLVTGISHRFGSHSGPQWPEPIDAALVLPVKRPGLPQPYGVLVAGLSPRLHLDDKYRDFLMLVSDQIATSISTARAHAEERRRADALIELDRQKTAFFSNVSHEFRTPLTLLLAPLEEAMARGPRMLAEAEVELAHRNASRLLRLVNTLLDFSRLEAGRAQAALQPTDLTSLTRDLASNFRSVMELGGLAFDVECRALSRPVAIDVEMWEKIVLNLLSNAFKFTLQGSVRVELVEVDDRVELHVHDTGAGIPDEDVAHVFDRFHRVAGTPSRTFEGSGIGLSLVRELVHLHGGEIRVSSVPGRGSTFTVSVPTSAVADGSQAGPLRSGLPEAAAPYVDEARSWIGEDPLLAPAPIAADSPAERPTRILVVDDNADMRRYLTGLLGHRYHVELASDGEAALAHIRAAPPALVLADGMMPKLDGFGLLKALREDERFRALPVILLSARAGEEARIDGLDAGADEYLVKPFSAQELVACVGSQLRLASLRREASEERTRLLEALYASAQEASRLKDEFLASLSHELRTPLNAVLGYARMLRSGMVPADRYDKTVETIERNARSLAQIVEDVLDISRITSGKIRLTMASVDLLEAVRNALDVVAPAAAAKGVRLERDLDPLVPAIAGDAERLQQILWNLLSNGVKFTDRGGSVRVGVARVNNDVEVTVSDTGIGIAPEFLPFVFERFHQADTGVTRERGGLGLGLSIARQLAEMHGGTIEAFSHGVGQGSRFRLRLPAP